MQIKGSHIILLGIILVLVFLLIRGCQNEDDFKRMIRASGDSLQTERNEKNEQIGHISILQGTVKELMMLDGEKDSTIAKLQKAVKDHKNSNVVVVAGVNTTFSHEGNTNVTGRDTIIKNDTVYVYPEYNSSYSDEWVKYDVLSNKDTTTLKLVVHNDFEYWQDYKKKLFKRSVYTANWLNKNPYTEITELSSFNFKEKRKFMTIGVGYMMGLDADFKIKGVLGVGVQMPIISF